MLTASHESYPAWKPDMPTDSCSKRSLLAARFQTYAHRATPKSACTSSTPSPFGRHVFDREVNLWRAFLTDPFIRSLRPTERGRVEYWDDNVTGLSIRVSDAGRKTWSVVYRISGRLRMHHDHDGDAPG